MNLGIYLLIYFFYILAGGADIYFAIDQFKQKHYFRFGIWMMCAISSVLFLTELIFTN